MTDRTYPRVLEGSTSFAATLTVAVFSLLLLVLAY